MWGEAAKWLAKFPEAVVTAVDGGGYPVSIRQGSSRFDAQTGELPVVWPPDVAVAEGPANILCHSHDEKLWNITSMQIKGRLERHGDDWVFVGSAFTPPAPMAVAIWRGAKNGRAATNRYLDKRGLSSPPVNWDSIKEIQRRAKNRQL